MAGLAGIQQKELIELVQQHFPSKGHAEIRAMLNQCQNEIVRKAPGIIKRSDTGITTTAATRFYDLDVDILDILRVELTDSDGNYYSIPRVSLIPGTEE
jgi:hypothetical protein